MTEFKITKTGEYKTRDGRKAIVLGIRTDIKTGCPVIGYIEGNELAEWSLEGRWNPDVQDDYDIIGEWVEPVVVDKWVNVYSDDEMYCYDSKSIAHEKCLIDKDSYRHTCHIRYTEGKGFEILWQGNLLEKEK